MELKGLPFVTFHILCNYCLENGLSFIPDRCVLVLEQWPWEIVDTFMLGTVGRLDSAGPDPLLTIAAIFYYTEAGIGHI